MLSQARLVEALEADMLVCQSDRPEITNKQSQQRKILDFNTLMNHRDWAKRAGNDQKELERVVKSLEANGFVGNYQRWRDVSLVREGAGDSQNYDDLALRAK